MSNPYEHNSILGQLIPREIARMAGVLAPTQEESANWFQRICRVTDELWDTNSPVTLPASAELRDEIFAGVSETTDDLTRHQLWIVFTDLGAYTEPSVASHLNNAHSVDNLARYTLHDVGTRLVVELLGYLQDRERPTRPFINPVIDAVDDPEGETPGH